VEDSSRPFKVVSGDLTTIAIGTAFNINQFNEEKLCISLLNGKVKVENNLTEENITLDPGQQLRYFPESGKSSIAKFSAEDIMAWKEGVLKFSNASFWEVVKSLERWYGVSITVSGRPGNSWLLTGDYKNQNLDLVLERMAYIEAFEYSIKQKKVYIKFQ
jgi:ferric-dicitrate binding protein FerR (iron transport regulator)